MPFWSIVRVSIVVALAVFLFSEVGRAEYRAAAARARLVDDRMGAGGAYVAAWERATAAAR